MSNFFLRFWKVKPIWPRNNKNANLLTIILPCFPPLISAKVNNSSSVKKKRGLKIQKFADIYANG